LAPVDLSDVGLRLCHVALRKPHFKLKQVPFRAASHTVEAAVAVHEKRAGRVLFIVEGAAHRHLFPCGDALAGVALLEVRNDLVESEVYDALQ
jgi:hypothetical protein